MEPKCHPPMMHQSLSSTTALLSFMLATLCCWQVALSKPNRLDEASQAAQLNKNQPLILFHYRLPFNPTNGRASHLDFLKIDPSNPARILRGLKFANGRWYFKRGFKSDSLAAARGFGKRGGSFAGFKANTLAGARGFGKRRPSGFKANALAGARGFGKRVKALIGFKADTLVGARGFGKRSLPYEEIDHEEDSEIAPYSPTWDPAANAQLSDDAQDGTIFLPPANFPSDFQWPHLAFGIMGKNPTDEEGGFNRVPFRTMLLQAGPDPSAWREVGSPTSRGSNVREDGFDTGSGEVEDTYPARFPATASSESAEDGTALYESQNAAEAKIAEEPDVSSTDDNNRSSS